MGDLDNVFLLVDDPLRNAFHRIANGGYWRFVAEAVADQLLSDHVLGTATDWTELRTAVRERWPKADMWTAIWKWARRYARRRGWIDAG